MHASPWPDRVTGEINELSERAAMGLPDTYVAPRLAVTSATVDIASKAAEERGCRAKAAITPTVAPSTTSG